VKPRASDLAATLLRPALDGADFPLALERVYGRAAPLAIEIGFGGGEALAWWAQQRPAWNFLGFEQPPECVTRAARAVTAAAVADRVRLVRGDARHLLRELVPPGAAQRVLMQFPMPWPKQRHAKHRLTDAEFRDGLASALAPGGRFELVTDQETFAREMAESFAPDEAFAAEAPLADPPRAFRTRYERRWLAEGRTIWRFRAALRTRRSADPVRGMVCEFKDAYAAEDGWLIELLAADGGFSQIFLARIRARADGGALLRVDECARPYPTPAVVEALRWLSRELA
jgi:tRNA (guanine-N7-)-methyltransferase